MNPDIHTTVTFSQLEVQKPFILKALEYFSFNIATPVQEKCIPKGLLGENMIVQAKNGTGKTLAFVLIQKPRLYQAKQYLNESIF